MYDEKKFADFNAMLSGSKNDGVVMVLVLRPGVLGDTYEELTENLNRISDRGLTLRIVPRSERSKT